MKSSSEASNLDQWNVALENAGSQPKIAALMTELGFGPETLAQGRILLTQTRAVYDLNETEDDETSEASGEFKSKKAELSGIYRMHRKKAKIVFRNDGLTLEKLWLLGSLPQIYIKWLETVRKFYTVAAEDPEIQPKLLRLRISADDITAANALIDEVKTARTNYLREVGESQDATKAKDAAMAEMEDWMSEFYAVARIALEDNPQLLEALGKQVKS